MTRTACPLIILQNADTTWELLDFCSKQKSILSLLLRRSGSCERIFEDQDDRVTPEEHLRDESVLVDWLCLLFAWICCLINRLKGLEWKFDQGMACVKAMLVCFAKNISLPPQAFTFAGLGQLCPHLLHPLKHHVAMPESNWDRYQAWNSLKVKTSLPIKSLHPSQKLLVVPETDRI